MDTEPCWTACATLQKASGQLLFSKEEIDILTYFDAHSTKKTRLKYGVSKKKLKDLRNVAINKLKQFKPNRHHEILDHDGLENRLHDGTFEEDGWDAVEIAYHPTYGWK